MAVGTQIKIERPGKAGAVTPVDSICGPTVLLDNGDLVQVNDRDTLEKVNGRIKQITDIGEILIPFGEFAENNHILIQGSFSEDWWEREVELALYLKEKDSMDDPFSEAYELEIEINRIRKKEMEPYAASKCQEPLPSEEELKKIQKECEEKAESKVRDHLKDAALRARSIDRELGSIDITP